MSEKIYVHIEYYQDGKVKEEGLINNGLKEGVWIEYYHNKTPKVKKYYLSGEKHGTFEYFKENSELDFKVQYNLGKIKVSNFNIKKII